MKNIKSHFVFNKQQRNGIFFLLVLIVIFQCIYFFVIPINTRTSPNENDLLKDIKFIAYQKQIDSLKRVEFESKKFQIFPFNPNYISDYKGHSLGMTNEQIDKLFVHRQSGLFVNSSNEFQKITGVSDSLLQVMSPYFKFPDWVNKNNLPNYNKRTNRKEKELIAIKDLNIVTVEDLKKIRGIGDKLSERIVKYRNKLEGFTFDDQLDEVYGLEKGVVDAVLKSYPIQTVPEIKKMNINEASLKELNSIIYIKYNLAKRIIEYRSGVGKIRNMEELLKIEGFTPEKISRIKLYLMIE